MFVAMATAMLLVVSVLVRGASRESARRTRAETELDAEQRLVEYLEVALLPAQLPTVTGVTVAARYVSGSPGRVGGDWYPAFQIAPDRIGLTVGDVVGHGVDATGAMAEMRHALRAFASVDRTRGACSSGSTGRARLDAELARIGRIRRVGRRRGYVELREGGQLGAFLVLHSGGLIERRTESLDVGMERMVAAIMRQRAVDLDAFCDGLLDRLRGERFEDAVVVLVACVDS